jgi:hypothetical protein
MEPMILSSIKDSPDSITEMDGTRKAISIARSDIMSVLLRKGVVAERPVAQFIVSAIFVAGGLWLGRERELIKLSDY